MYDVIIIGAGPSGLAAAIYAGRAKLNTLVLEKAKAGGRAETTREIVNYPGVPNTTGPILSNTMFEQAKSFNVEFKTETVKSLNLKEPIKIVKTRKNEYLAKTVILAMGTSPRILNIPGEKELAGRGVAYCATCDGEFFKDQEIAVVGSGDQAIEESLYLTRFVKKINIIVIHKNGVLDCNKVAANKAFNNPKLNFIFNSTVKSINGTDEVESIDVENIETNKVSNLKVKGIFMFVGMSPNSELVKDTITNQKGWIVTNKRMETNCNGVYAVGDIRIKDLRQVVTSVSDGAIAATMASRYIDELYDLKDVVSNKQIDKIVFFDSSDQISTDSTRGLTNCEKIDVLFHKSLAELLNVDLNNDLHIDVLNSNDVANKLHL